MNDIKNLVAAIGERLKQLAQSNAVVSKPISYGDRHVLPLCQLSLAFGSGGGSQDDENNREKSNGKNAGSGTGGSAKATPVAVVVVDGQDVRIETLGK